MGSVEEFRGSALRASGRRFAREAGWLARFVSPGFHRVLDRIDAGLEHGSLLARLPDGSTRLLGGRAPGHACEVALHDWRALVRLATNGSIGWYQAWAAGEWSSPDPVPLFALFMHNAATLGSTARAQAGWRLAARAAHWLNRNSKRGAARNIHAHYDLGNAFYAAWLDPTMSYSSALFEAGDTIEQAQYRKMDAMAQRLGKADTVLEIGCGWGALADRLAGQGRTVTAVSLSPAQLDWARRHRAPQVDFRQEDYRDVSGSFDAIVSVEMVEALGRENWPVFLNCVARNLRRGGRAAIQYISIRDDLFDAYEASADFIQAYVFPGGCLIRTSEFRRLAEERGLAWHDQRDFGQDYARTLLEWRNAVDRAATCGALPEGVDDGFLSLWRYYLMYCEGGFRGGGIDVHQVTLIKE